MSTTYTAEQEQLIGTIGNNTLKNAAIPQAGDYIFFVDQHNHTIREQDRLGAEALNELHKANNEELHTKLQKRLDGLRGGITQQLDTMHQYNDNPKRAGLPQDKQSQKSAEDAFEAAEEVQRKLDKAKAEHDAVLKAYNKEIGESVTSDDRNKVVTKYKDILPQAEKTYRSSMFSALDAEKVSAAQLELSRAHHAVHLGEQAGADTTGLKLREDLIKKLHTKENAPKAEQLATGAGKYLQDQDKAIEAREALETKTVAEYTAKIEKQISSYYDAQKVKDGVSLEPSRIKEIDEEKADAIRKVKEKGDVYAKQLNLVNERLDVATDEHGNALSQAQKQSLRQDFIKSAVRYNGDPSKFAGSFLADHGQRPLDVGADLRMNNISPESVTGITLRGDSVEISVAGRKDPIALSKRSADQVRKHGLDLEGLAQNVRINVAQDSGINDDTQLLLHNTKGHNVSVNPVASSSLAGRSHNADDLGRMSNMVQNVISTDPDDKNFSKSVGNRAWGLDVAQREATAKETISKASRLSKLDGLEAQARAAVSGLSPSSRAALTSLQDAGANGTMVGSPNAPRGKGASVELS